MMPRVPRNLLLLLLATGAVAACDDVVLPGGPRPVDLVSGTPGSDARLEGATAPPTVRTTTGEIAVLGILGTPNPCQDLSAELVRDETLIELRIRARARPVVCVDMIGTFAYRARAQVPSGSYSLRVRHEYPGTGWPAEVARETTVIVP
jgi:hypothetical protein